jgi:hypothetical protein
MECGAYSNNAMSSRRLKKNAHYIFYFYQNCDEISFKKNRYEFSSASSKYGSTFIY